MKATIINATAAMQTFFTRHAAPTELRASLGHILAEYANHAGMDADELADKNADFAVLFDLYKTL